MPSRNMSRTQYADWPACRGNGLDVSDDWRRVSGLAGRINHRDAPVQGKPDSPRRVRDHGLLTLHTFQTAQAISESILTHIPILKGSLQKLFSIHPQYVAGRCEPERPVSVFGDPEDFLPEGRGCSRGNSKLIVVVEGNTRDRSHPEHSG